MPVASVANGSAQAVGGFLFGQRGLGFFQRQAGTVDRLVGAANGVDLRLVVDTFAEGIRPEGAELAGRRGSPVRRDLRREHREQASHVPQDSRKRGEFQSFPFLVACNGSLTTSLRVALDRVKRASMRCDTKGTVVRSHVSTFGRSP